MVYLKDGLVCTGGPGGHSSSFLQQLLYLRPWQALNELVCVIPLLYNFKEKWLVVSFCFRKMMKKF